MTERNNRYSVWIRQQYAILNKAEYETWAEAKAAMDGANNHYKHQSNPAPWRIWDKSVYPPLDVTDKNPELEGPSKEEPVPVFTPIRPLDTEGWQYQGEPIPDDVVLAFAKRGYLIEHYESENYPRNNRAILWNKDGKKHTYKPGQWIVWGKYAGEVKILNTTDSNSEWTSLD